jgi:hypothetical protein
MKIRSESELEECIDKEYSWRRKELTNFKNTTFTSRKALRNTFAKMLIVLLYSHWEGFIKKAAIAYCEFLNSKGIKYCDLEDNFKVYCILNKFDGNFPYKKFGSYIDVINIINSKLDEKLNINAEKYVDAKSNLNSDVLKDIVQKLGFNYAEYELQENLIDNTFLSLRNAIAHGEYKEIDEKTVEELYEEIINLINCFKNQVSNSVCNHSYLLTR